MTYINSNQIHSRSHGNRSHRSHSNHENRANRRSGHHFNQARSRRGSRDGSSRRNQMRSHMSRIGHHQSRQLHGTRRHGANRRGYNQHHIGRQHDSRFQTQRRNNPLTEIQSLLQGFDMNSIGSLLQQVSPDELSMLLQQQSGINASADDITQILQQFGLTTGANTDNNPTPMPVEPDNGIGDGAGPIPTTPDAANTDPLADIQSLLQGFDMDDISSLLQQISPEELAALLQQESGMNVSADDIAQLLQQLGLVTGNSDPAPMPVEPDNGIGDGGVPIPTMPDPANTDSLAEIQSLLQGFNMGDISSLLQMVSPDELAALLQQESGMNVSADDINLLFQQLGLTIDTSTASNPTSIPTEPVNTANTNNATTTSTTTNNQDSSSNSDIQSLLQGIDPDDISLLLQSISAEQLAEMLQQDSGLTVSADDITQLLEQIQQDSNDTSAPSNPIPVEPDNGNGGIGDSAPDLGDLLPTQADTTSSEVDQVLQNIDPALLSELLQMVSLDELANMLQQESGISISAEQIQQLLDQTGLTNTVATQPAPANNTSTSADTSSTDTDSSTEPATSNDTQDQDVVDAAPAEETNNPATTSNDSPANPSTANTEEIENLLQGIDSNQLASFFDIFSAEQLAEMLSQEGTEISADEIQALLSQIGLSA